MNQSSTVDLLKRKISGSDSKNFSSVVHIELISRGKKRTSAMMKVDSIGN